MKNLISKRFLLLLLVVGMLLGCDRHGTTPVPAAGEAGGPSASAPQSNEILTVTLATFSKAIANAPFYVVQDQKLFDKEPALSRVKFRFQEYNDRAAIGDAFGSNQLQVLFSAEIPVVLLRAQGSDVRIVLASAASRQEILARDQSNIKTMAGLKGKKLAVQQGTSSHYALMKALRAANLKSTDLDFRTMLAAEAKPAFETGAIDAWAVWPPWTEQQLLKKNCATLPGSDARIVSVVTMSYPFVKQHPEQARAILAAINRARAWLVENREEAMRVVSEQRSYLPYKVDEVALAFPKYDWGLQLNDEMLEDFQGKADFLAAEKMTRDNKRVDVRADLVLTQLP